MFHWPISAAIVGITTNLFFISLICILSYLHFTHEDDLQDEQFNYEKGQMEKNSSDKNSTDGWYCSNHCGFKNSLNL